MTAEIDAGFANATVKGFFEGATNTTVKRSEQLSGLRPVRL